MPSFFTKSYKAARLLAPWLLILLSLPLAAQIDAGWQALWEGRHEEARVAFEAASMDDPLVEIGWFLAHTGKGSNRDLDEAALAVVRRDPLSPASEFVLKWMMPLRECGGDFLADLAAIIAPLDPLNPELKTLFATYLRAQVINLPEPPDFLAITQASGYLTDWKVTPRYGAYAIPAFEHSWPPEQVTGWQDAIAQQTRSGVFNPPRIAYGQGVFYAFAEFQNPVAQDVFLRLFSYNEIALYVDGKRWGENNNLREIGPNIRYFKGRLPAGRHEIVIKTSQTTQNNGQFSVQVTAAQAPKILLPGTPAHDLAGKATAVAQAEVGLNALVASDDSDPARLVRARLALADKDEETALDILEDLIARYPQSQIVGALIANLYLNNVTFLPAEMQFSAAYQILSALSQASNPDNIENRFALSLLMIKARQTRAALELLNGILQENPEYCDAIQARLLLARQETLHDVREQTRQLIKDKGPENRWAQKLLFSEARGEGDLDLTRTLLENLGRLLPWEGYIAQRHDMDENYEAAIEDFNKRWLIFSDRDFYPFAIAQAKAKLGDRAGQREWLEKALEVNPGNREAILDMVNLDCFEGRTEQARERLAAYLRIEPGDAFFRQRLSHLEGRTAFESLRQDTAKVIEKAKSKPISEGADSELLLDQLMVRLFKDGSQMRYTHLVRRVLTKKGVDEESELNLPKDLEILELRTIKADGSVYYPEDFAGKSSISLVGLGIGDFIDEEHIEYLPPAYYDEDGLDAEMTFIFQGVDRIYHHSELVLIYPEGLAPAPVLQSKNMDFEPEISTHDGLVTVRWLTENMPPLIEEPAGPLRDFSQPTATFYYNTTWREVRDFYYNTTATRKELSRRVLAQVEQWRAAAKDRRDLAETVYVTLADRTEPGNSFYQDASIVWETRAGNPSLLMTAIYQELGYDCQLVFVAPEEMGHYLIDTPQPIYSYTLIRLNLDGETFWLDPNQKGLPFGYVPFPYRNTRGLVMSLGDEIFTQVPAFDDSTEGVETLYKMYPREDGTVNGMGSEKFYGLFASQMSQRYEKLNQPEIEQRVEAGINQTFPGASVSRVGITPDLPRGAFELTYDFGHPGGLVQTDGAHMTMPFPLPATPLLERYGTLPRRQTPIRIRSPHFNVARMELNAPAGYRWETQPMVKKLESTFGKYKLTVERENDRKLIVTRAYHVPASFVQPEQYADFLVFCRGMIENEDIIFKAVKDGGQP